jgi:thioredoxin-related protein
MSTVNWRTDWPAALEEAKAAQRPLVLELYLETCPHCQQLARETHSDAAVAAALNGRFIPVRLEGRQHLDLVQKLEVRGAPTTLIFSSEGQELQRVTGFLPPEEYLKELNKAG